ncbi:MAG: PASTA domain-containing protein [Mogibacterium sp.]|nr:PASTA domain-containing protein [Mogibacterium sp.]
MARNKDTSKTDKNINTPDKADIKGSRISHAVYRPYRITPMNRRRLVGGFAVILLLMTALIYRMGYWQIVRADELRVMAAEMQKVDTQIDPVRGAIYDSRMSTLAETVTEYELYAYTQYLYKDENVRPAQKRKIVTDLAKITGSSKVDIQKKLEGEENLVLLADGLTREQVENAKKEFDGKVDVRTRAARYYPNGAFAAQILGGVNADNVGRSGLEYQYNSVLAGIKGRTIRTTDPDGNTLTSGNSRTYRAQNGYSIVTTVDSVIQHFTEDALETGMQKTGAEAITCIVTDPKTGNILAMASTPEYDPNKSSEPYSAAEKKKFKKMTAEEQTEYLSRMWTVRGISNVYEPGSTFKLITAASALESANSSKKSRYYCNGYIHVDNYNLRCLSTHGKQTLKEAVGNSCNPALAQVALDMGADTFYNYIDLFGFNDKTGVDLPGETRSIVKDPDGMGNVDLATTGYGQGIAVTPLQILCAVNTFGNGGVLMKPKLVSRIVDSKGKTVESFEDTAVRQVVSEQTAEKMCDIMEYYVSDAGGTGAYVPGYRVGGKTGTANLVEGSSYARNATNTSFVAMAPMDDPVISMICIVYKPTKTQFGNFTAGPIVQEIMEKSLQYLGVERKYSKNEKKEAEKDLVEVPDVTGMNSNKAVSVLANSKLGYRVVPENSGSGFAVQAQQPKAGSKVKKNSIVYIYSE